MIKTFAVLVTEENTTLINECAARKGLNHEVQYDMEEAVDFDTVCYAILSLNYETKQAVFTTMWKEDFFNNWCFTNGSIHNDLLHEVKLVNPK